MAKPAKIIHLKFGGVGEGDCPYRLGMTDEDVVSSCLKIP